MRGKKNREVNIFSASVVDLFASGLGVFLIVSIIALVNQKKENIKFRENEKIMGAISNNQAPVVTKVDSNFQEQIQKKNSEILQLKMEIIKLKSEQKSGANTDFTDANHSYELNKDIVQLHHLIDQLENKLKDREKKVKQLEKSLDFIEQLRVSEKIIKDPKFKSFEVGTIVKMDNVQFYPGTPRGIEPYASREILELSIFLKNNPNISIEVSGHIYLSADDISSGKKEDTTNLSVKRALYVCDKLTEFGISSRRLRCVGYGASRPVHLTNDDYSLEAQMNRRVEVEILSK